MAQHAYSVVGAIKLSEFTDRKELLLKIRNPHGRNEWNGAWSDRSPLWTPQLRAVLGVEACEDGM